MGKRDRARLLRFVCLLLPIAIFHLPSAGLAATQEEFFRSMQQSVDGGGGGTEAGRILMLIVAGAALVGLVMLLGRQRTRKVAQLRAPHNPRKLLKEITRASRVTAGEMRQLKVLADQESCASPITLLLCPSLLVKGIQQQGSKADRQVLLQLAKKMGLTKQKK
jgi:hypothetical protein